MARRLSTARTHTRAQRPRGTRPPLRQYPDTNVAFPYLASWGDTALPNVTENVLLGLPTANWCLGRIANGVAAMSPPRMIAGDGITELDAPLIAVRPNASLGVYEFFHAATACAVARGNYYGILADFDSAGFARQVVPVHPDLVQVIVEAGFVFYMIGDQTYTADEMLHVRGHTIVGSPVGIGVVEFFRRSIGQHLDQQSLVASTFSTGGAAIPSGIVKVAKPEITKDQADAVKEQFVTAHSGQRSIAVLSEMYDFTAISWSPEDAQFLESRQFSVAEMALMFGFDPGDLSASVGGTSITYANITDREAARQIDVYGPWIARFEDQWSDLVPGGNLIRFRRESFKHANRKALFEEQAIGIAAGVLTVDEARAENNKAPLPKPKLIAPPPAPVLGPDGNPVPPTPTPQPGATNV